MWKLKHIKKDHNENYVFVGEDFVIGRKDASLLIASDPSVSRKHAVLFVKHPEANLNNPSKKSSLFLRDEGSKYGTFKNGKRVTSEVELIDKDVVKFGQFESEYRIQYVPVVVTTSCLEISAKKELRKVIHLLGGHLISEWQPICTHLAMTEVKITVKALCCLLLARPIVKPEYFSELKKSLKSSATLLPTNQYIPPVGESLIDKDVVSFDVNQQRTDLFKNKTFFFLEEKQLQKLSLGIVLGGGKAEVLTNEHIKSETFLQQGFCVIEPTKDVRDTQELKSRISTVASILEDKNLRLIPESDIGLSVAYCSVEKFCNPFFNMGEVLRSQKIQSQSLSQADVYVPDTQETSLRRNAKRVGVADCISSLQLSSFQAEPADEMQVSEIPVSAQVKRELDIFAEPIRNENPANIQNGNQSIQKPTTPQEPYLPPAKKPKTEIISPQTNEKTSSKIRQELRDPPEPVSTKLVSEPPKSTTAKRPPTEQRESTSKRIKKEQVSVYQNGNTSINEVLSKNDKNIPDVKPQVPERRYDDKFLGYDSPSFIKTNCDEELPRNLARIEFAALVYRKPVAVVQPFNSSVKNFKKFKKVQPLKANVLPKIIGAHELIPYDKVAAEIQKEVWDDPPEVESQPTRGEFDW